VSKPAWRERAPLPSIGTCPFTDVGAERGARIVLERHSAAFDPLFRNVSRAAEDLRLDELLDRPPLTRWGRGPVALLGDAAHPMLPHAGQGAAQALEDAAVLARVLSAGGPLEPALRRYEAERARRTRRTVAMARRIAGVTTTRNPIVIRLRDTAVQTMPYRLLVNAFAG
jgi:2-polyprenyl-6-methoxyphenol hydroxylase-like FAD-dependent oxidoreductase